MEVGLAAEEQPHSFSSSHVESSSRFSTLTAEVPLVVTHQPWQEPHHRAGSPVILICYQRTGVAVKQHLCHSTAESFGSPAKETKTCPVGSEAKRCLSMLNGKNDILILAERPCLEPCTLDLVIDILRFHCCSGCFPCTVSY